MGIKQIVSDDLDGKTLPDDTKPLSVQVDGENFEVFLGAESKETFLAMLRGEAPILAKVKTATAKSSSKSTGTGSGVARHGYDFADVLPWAVSTKQKTKAGEPVAADTKVLHQGIWDAYREHMAESAE